MDESCVVKSASDPMAEEGRHLGVREFNKGSVSASQSHATFVNTLDERLRAMRLFVRTACTRRQLEGIVPSCKSIMRVVARMSEAKCISLVLAATIFAGVPQQSVAGQEKASQGTQQAQPKVARVPVTPSTDKPLTIEKQVKDTIQISVPVPERRNGIFVGTPKIYDNHALQTLLMVVRARLAQINGFDQASLIARLGALQGASVSQSQFGVTALGLPAAGETTTATGNAANSTTTASTQTNQAAGATAAGTTTDNRTVSNSPTSNTVAQTTVPSVSAVVPALPSPPTFSLPSAYAVSSLDLLNEQTQLNFELVNLQLLLGGSLSDDFVPNSRLVRRRITIGFPITITAPAGFDYRNAAAEVEIAVCNPVESPYRDTAPTLVTLLPRERTYNVANVVSRASSIGTGAVTGVVNLGGSFLRGRQTLYVVRDQDTIALQRESTDHCKHDVVYSDDVKDTLESRHVTFAWQFRPVLGHEVLTSGTRETFAQISMPPGAGACPQQAVIRTVWRRYDRETGRVGQEVKDSAYTTWVTLPGYDMTPRPDSVTALDNGDGTLTVRARGTYTSAVRVKVGTTSHDETTPGFERTSTQIQFVAPAAAIASKGAYLVHRDGHEARLFAPRTGSETESLCKIEQQEVGSVAIAPPASVSATATQIRISQLTTTTSLVSLTLPAAVASGEPHFPIVILGPRVFGLRDAPFDAYDESAKTVSFRAPTQLVRGSRELTFMQLFLDVPPIRFPIASDISTLTISAITLLSSDAQNGNSYLLTGTNLDGVTVMFPSGPTQVSVDNSKTTARFQLSAAQLKGVKNIVLQHGQEPPVVLALPTGTPEARPPLDRQAAVPVGAKTLEVTGSMYDSVVAVRYLEKPVAFFLDKQARKIVVQLPDGVTAAPGTQVLEFIFSDKTTARFEVPVGVQ
jgi:hypothetical protein